MPIVNPSDFLGDSLALLILGGAAFGVYWLYKNSSTACILGHGPGCNPPATNPPTSDAFNQGFSAGAVIQSGMASNASPYATATGLEAALGSGS